MKSPERYDSSGFLDELGIDEEEEFRDLYREKWRDIDEQRAIETFESSFDSSVKRKYRLYRDIVNAFSDESVADGSNSGFETTISNPLYDFGESGAEVLLAKKQPTGLHLCFVSCNVSADGVDEWREQINRTAELMTDSDNRTKLKEHIECSDLEIRTVQYLTFTNAFELVDIDLEVLRYGTDVDDYAVWELIESELPDDEVETSNKVIKHREGNVAVPDLERVGREGIDPTLTENDDFRVCLTTHPVYSLREVLLDLYLGNLSGDEPKEFDRSGMAHTFRDLSYFGENRDQIDELVDVRIDELLEFALDYGIVSEDEDVVEQGDYRIMWGSEDPGDIKEMVKEKYISDMVPDEMGGLAFDRAKEEFERLNKSLDDYQ